MQMVGIIFSNIYDSTMGVLTKNRTLASLPFGARYRQIDFVLSNMINSNIKNVGIVTKYNYQSLMDHLGCCSDWDIYGKNGGVFILPPFSMGNINLYKGKIDALYGAINFLKRVNEKYVIVSDCTEICNIDLDKVLKSHVQSGVDVTVIANRETKTHPYERRDLVLNENDGKVEEVLTDASFNENQLSGMGMYIMNKDFLIQSVIHAVENGFYHFEKQFLQREFTNGNITVGFYEFTGTVLRNLDIESYFDNNLKMMNEEVRNEIFSGTSPIYTKILDEPPTYYGDKSNVKDCLVADGCIINGNAENCIIFRDVKIDEGCTVKNSIIMQGTHIQHNSKLEYVISDKNVVVSENNVLQGAKKSLLIIEKNKTI